MIKVEQKLTYEIDALKAREEKLVGALKFYASSDNWTATESQSLVWDYSTIIGDREHGFDSSVGGKLARKTLKELGIEL